MGASVRIQRCVRRRALERQDRFIIRTPFNGEHNAGPLVMISVPDAQTDLGPLCVNPTSRRIPSAAIRERRLSAAPVPGA
jgi:hypothetical protein